jgi:membrane-associated phospholipid phosphatase
MTLKLFFLTLPGNIARCFKGRMLIWHGAAIALTFDLVTSGLDWRYFLSTRSSSLRSWMFPAVHIGGLLPIALPLILIALGILTASAQTRLIAAAVAQSELVGALMAAAYKALTGRAHPMRAVGPDLSHIFKFGLLRGGVFWGWPSSHTTVAFAMAVAVLRLFPKQRWLGFLAITYALYVGVGVSMTIHWFSDFVAGAIFGSVVGVVVGNTFCQARTDCCPVQAPRSEGALGSPGSR